MSIRCHGTDNFSSGGCTLAVGLLIMMYPILCKVRYESLHELFKRRDVWKQIAFSVFVNWVVAPFLMVSTSHLWQLTTD